MLWIGAVVVRRALLDDRRPLTSSRDRSAVESPIAGELSFVGLHAAPLSGLTDNVRSNGRLELKKE